MVTVEPGGEDDSHGYTGDALRNLLSEPCTATGSQHRVARQIETFFNDGLYKRPHRDVFERQI